MKYKKSNFYIYNCYIKARKEDKNFIINDKQIKLNGYAIIPLEDLKEYLNWYYHNFNFADSDSEHKNLYPHISFDISSEMIAEADKQLS